MRMRFLIIPDLHGRMPLISTKKFDAIIAVGDFCDDRKIRPYIKKWFAYSKKYGKDTSLSVFLEKNLTKKQLDKIEDDSLKVGRKILEKLNSFGKPVFIVPGNHDKSEEIEKVKKDQGSFKITPSQYTYAFLCYYLNAKTNPKLIKGLKNVYDCQYRLHKFPGFNILAYGISSVLETPSLRLKGRVKKGKEKTYYEKSKKTYKKIIQKLDKQYAKIDKKNPTIFLTHNVPYNVGKLDQVNNPSSYAHGKHFGSTVARQFCTRHKPLVCVGGHIHEGFGKAKLGKTTVINAGYGPKKNVLLEVKNGKIKKLQFIDREKLKKR